MKDEASTSFDESPPRRLSRRRLLAHLAAWTVLPLGAGAYASQIEPFWLQVHELPMPLRNLPPSFEGFRLAQLSDLHAGEEVPLSYLRESIERIDAERPDCVVVTGDLVTNDTAWIDRACELLGRLHAPVYVIFGNHDYHPGATVHIRTTRIAEALESRLRARGITVLRNRAASIEHDDGRIWLVGLEEWISGLFDADAAFAIVDPSEPVIALSHNPDSARTLDAHRPQWILSGHTHGGQVRVPGLGAPVLPTEQRDFDQGLFQLEHARLYVSRGVGFVRRVRMCCRPETPIFVMRSESEIEI